MATPETRIKSIQRPPDLDEDEVDFSLGWREQVVHTADGGIELLQIPLTPEEALHPEEDFVGPEPSYQDVISDDICDMLRPHCAQRDPKQKVARNLLIKWDKPGLKKHAPDVCVIPNVSDPEAHWTTFYVAKEKTRPCLIIEIVSPASKEADRVKKVDHYARAGVQEYVYIDYWRRKGQMQWEIAGFRLHRNRYLPMLPDEDGAIYCETVGVRMGVENGKVWMENYETGERLLTNIEARQEAKIQLAAMEAARQAAEARIAELEAQLKALQQTRRTAEI
jgi:Uma2 family endonuclease